MPTLGGQYPEAAPGRMDGQNKGCGKRAGRGRRAEGGGGRDKEATQFIEIRYDYRREGLKFNEISHDYRSDWLKLNKLTYD